MNTTAFNIANYESVLAVLKTIATGTEIKPYAKVVIINLND